MEHLAMASILIGCLWGATGGVSEDAGGDLGMTSAGVGASPQPSPASTRAQAPPQEAARRYRRGVTRLRAKRYALAARDFLDAVRGAPSYPAAWCNLGVALYRLHRYRAAAQALRRALRQRIDSAMAWNNLGVVNARLGRDGYAAVAFQVALTYDPGHAPARRNLRRIK